MVRHLCSLSRTWIAALLGVALSFVGACAAWSVPSVANCANETPDVSGCTVFREGYDCVSDLNGCCAFYTTIYYNCPAEPFDRVTYTQAQLWPPGCVCQYSGQPPNNWGSCDHCS
jgi:hypothetical protein